MKNTKFKKYFTVIGLFFLSGCILLLLGYALGGTSQLEDKINSYFSYGHSSQCQGHSWQGESKKESLAIDSIDIKISVGEVFIHSDMEKGFRYSGSQIPPQLFFSICERWYIKGLYYI